MQIEKNVGGTHLSVGISY